MGFITPDGFKHLDAYKYVSGGYSYLDNIFNHFWEAVAKLLPMWLAPNLITFIGFIFMMMSYLIMIPYDQTFSNNIPRWTFFAAGLFQFIYQTLDAVDGKQARRTKSSSPLGQLFDHGCDSFSVSFLILSIAEAAKFGMDQDNLFLVSSVLYYSFWISNWSEYHTKVLRTHMFNFGVTETELVIIGVLLTSGVFGQDFWLTPIGHFIPQFIISQLPQAGWLTTLFQTSTKNCLMFTMLCSITFIIFYVLITTIKATKQKLEAILQNIPVLMFLGISYLWKNSTIYSKNISIVSLIFGLNFSLLTCKLIVCSLTEMRFPKFHRELAYFTLATLLLRLDLLLPKVNLGFDVDRGVLICSLIFTVLSAVLWSKQVIQEITSHLGIYCFSLQKRPRVKSD